MKKKVVIIWGMIPATIDEAIAMLIAWLAKYPNQAVPELTGLLIGSDISQAQYNKALSDHFLGKGTDIEVSNGGTCTLDFFSGLEMWYELPANREEPIRYITIDLDEMEDYIKALPARTLSDIPAAVVRNCVLAYLECGEDWVLEVGCPAWFTAISPKNDEMIKLLEDLNVIFYGSFKDYRKLIGYDKMSMMAADLYIPLRTVEDWEYGKNQCKLYLRLLIARAKGILCY